MDKRGNKEDKNIVLYPGLVKRLIEKGMDALKEKDSHAAYEFFLSAEEHEPDHPQVLFGKMLSLVELGRLEEAVEHTSSLLHEGIGDYYENLQVHISLLVQLGEYKEVVNILDAVLSENRIPSQHAESFYQLLHFSRQMINQEVDEMSAPVEETVEMLQADSPELQLQALGQLKYIKHKDAMNALISYVERKDRDLALQSIALQALLEKGCDTRIHIEKQGRDMVVIPIQLEDLYELSFGNDVVSRLGSELEHENPLLFDMAKQLCWAHLLALYPFLPEPQDITLWSSVFHYCAAKRIGLDEELERIEARYHIKRKELMDKVTEVREIEGKVFQVDPFYSGKNDQV
ncbi:hypothetical protein GN156_03335 [bacterium LRH843]|nr:hypothetical protein [bacterium LRH843]